MRGPFRVLVLVPGPVHGPGGLARSSRPEEVSDPAVADGGYSFPSPVPFPSPSLSFPFPYDRPLNALDRQAEAAYFPTAGLVPQLIVPEAGDTADHSSMDEPRVEVECQATLIRHARWLPMPFPQVVAEADTSDVDASRKPTIDPRTISPLPVSENPSFHAPQQHPSPSPDAAAPRNTLVPARHGAHAVPSPSLVRAQTPPSVHQTRTAARRRTAPVAGGSTRARAPCPVVRARGSLVRAGRSGRGSSRGKACLVVVDGSLCVVDRLTLPYLHHLTFLHLHPSSPSLLPSPSTSPA